MILLKKPEIDYFLKETYDTFILHFPFGNFAKIVNVLFKKYFHNKIVIFLNDFCPTKCLGYTYQQFG